MVKDFRKLLFIVVLSNCISAFAVTPPPESPYNAIASIPLEKWDAKSIQKPVTHLSLGKYVVYFEKTSLADILDKVVIGQISHEGDAADSIYWLCYTLPKERIWIVSHGEMGGSNHVVTSVSGESNKSVQATNDCPSLPRDLLPVSLDNKLWLGINKETAYKALGNPSRIEGAWSSFDFSGKHPGECPPDGFDVMNWLIFKTEQEHITIIHAGQVTSC